MTSILLALARRFWGFVLAAALSVLATPANAEMVFSQVIVDLTAGAVPHQDVEVWNSGSERIYVVAEPSEIVFAGKADERRVQMADPAQLGLLVAPNRLILEPGERKLIRIAAIAERTGTERIYRVAIKPVTGDITAAGSGLKLLVGYDALVIVRPTELHSEITGTRIGNILTLRNDGNTNAELFDGKQCDGMGRNCVSLPPKRLYAGASWDQPLTRGTSATYSVKTGDAVAVRTFQP
ncbi:hypothetical protein [Sphingomonas sp.]|uniref:hypothetical protein n=1 Tax=Sphingomonas sp. TaxID=28214 RepID=UPI00307FA63F